MIAALQALRCEGVPTTAPMHIEILKNPHFRSGDYDTRAIPGWPPAGTGSTNGTHGAAGEDGPRDA